MLAEDRVQLYNKAFPKYPGMWYDKNWMLGIWSIGNCYKNDSKLYGAYPHGYLKRIMSIFPDKKDILHVFSGSLPPGPYLRVDINPDNQPDIVCNAEQLSESVKGEFDLFMLDPPYQKEDAVKYGYKLPNKAQVIKECYKLAKPGAHLVFMDERLPMYRKDQWKRIGEIYISRSTNHRVRGVFIFEKQ